MKKKYLSRKPKSKQRRQSRRRKRRGGMVTNEEPDLYIMTPLGPGGAAAPDVSIFAPLLVPLSGVISMTVLSHEDKLVLFIGEKHSKNFCREKGYTPFGQLLEPYIDFVQERRAFVDVMLEIPNSIPHAQVPLWEVRHILKGVQNRMYSDVADSEEPADYDPSEFEDEPARHQNILTLSSDLIAHLIPPQKANADPHLYTGSLPNTHFHWLDPASMFPQPEEKDADQLLDELAFYAEISRADVNENPEEQAENEEVIIETRQLIFNLAGLDESSIPFVTGTERENDSEAFTASSPLDKREFVRNVFTTLFQGKYFTKCSTEKRAFPLETYVDIFMRAWEGAELKLLDDFLFDIHRFIMDIYTCCRIMKREKNDTSHWFKNMVVYAGNFHVLKDINILMQNGFSAWRIDFTGKPFNPDCL